MLRSTTTEATKIPIQAFISCCLDYYNSLYGASNSLIQKIQWILNATACFITGARRCDNITHVSCQMASCPTMSRVQSYIPGAMSSQALTYLADDIKLVTNSGHCLLWSPADSSCIIPHTPFGPRVWNNLQPYLQSDIGYAKFIWQLNILWELTDHHALWLRVYLLIRNTLTYFFTYLLTQWTIKNVTLYFWL